MELLEVMDFCSQGLRLNHIENIAPYINHKFTETKCNIIFAYILKGSEEDALVRTSISPRVDETLQCSIPNAVCMF